MNEANFFLEGTMKEPLHPIETLRELYIKPLNLDTASLAEALQITTPYAYILIHRPHLNNKKMSIDLQLALRLAKAFGGSYESWLAMQVAYDRSKGKLNFLEKVKVLNKPKE